MNAALSVQKKVEPPVKDDQWIAFGNKTYIESATQNGTLKHFFILYRRLRHPPLDVP
jgi:hypothetical protein